MLQMQAVAITAQELNALVKLLDLEATLPTFRLTGPETARVRTFLDRIKARNA